MKTILVWILVTVSGGDELTVQHSPWMPSIEDCQRLQASHRLLAKRMINDRYGYEYAIQTQCVQMRVVISQ